MHKMFIIACSEPKAPGMVKAYQKYRSRQHREVAGAFDKLWNAGYGLFILSAEFGLVPAQRAVPDYDTKMDKAQATWHRAQIRAIIDALDPEEVVVYGGKVYREPVVAMAGGRKVVELVGADRGCGDHFSALQQFIAAA